FFYGGRVVNHPIEATNAQQQDTRVALYQTERSFPVDEFAAYRIPLPKGTYEITLHFTAFAFRAQNRRSFDVFIGGQEVLKEYEPFRDGSTTGDPQSFKIELKDGLLDIEFVPRIDNPTVSAIEIEPLE